MLHFSSQVTELKVASAGPLTKVLTVHNEKLMLSPFFDRLLEHHQSKVVLEAAASNLETYISFLYTKTLATSTAGPNNNPVALRIETYHLEKLYRFGVEKEDMNFRNATLDAIIEISQLKDKKTGVPYLPDPATFKDLPRESPARRCIIDLYVHFLDPETPFIDRPEHQKFMREILKASMRKSDMKSEHGDFRRRSLRPCDYHEHRNEVRCDDGDENLLDEPYFRIVFNLLVRFYVCGEQFLNQAIRHAVIRELIRLTELEDGNGNTWGIDNREISIIYQGTPEGSPARRLLVDMHVRGDPGQWPSEEADPAFILAAARAYNRNVETKSLEELDSCLKVEDYLWCDF